MTIHGAALAAAYPFELQHANDSAATFRKRGALQNRNKFPPPHVQTEIFKVL